MSQALDRARIVFGCGNFGGLGSSPALREKGDPRSRALALLDMARDHDLLRFDTANTYGGGDSERFLGEWLTAQSAEVRARAFIASKVGNPNGCPADARPLSREQVAFHLDASLRRLGVERIDLYYWHEFDPLTPYDETLEAFDRALAAGKIAEFGVSNASLDQLRGVLTLCGEGALRSAFTHVQNGFNRLEQGDLEAVIPLCAAERLAYVAFSPLAGGLLTGKYRPGETAAAGTRLSDAGWLYEPLLTPETFAVIDDLRRQGDAAGRSVASEALNWILGVPGVDSLIIAPRSPEQFAAYGLA